MPATKTKETHTNVWEVREIDEGVFLAALTNPDGSVHAVEVPAHCLACAKTVTYLRLGPVDTRGWPAQGECGEHFYDTVQLI